MTAHIFDFRNALFHQVERYILFFFPLCVHVHDTFLLGHVELRMLLQKLIYVGVQKCMKN